MHLIHMSYPCFLADCHSHSVSISFSWQIVWFPSQMYCQDHVVRDRIRGRQRSRWVFLSNPNKDVGNSLVDEIKMWCILFYSFKSELLSREWQVIMFTTPPKQGIWLFSSCWVFMSSRESEAQLFAASGQLRPEIWVKLKAENSTSSLGSYPKQHHLVLLKTSYNVEKQSQRERAGGLWVAFVHEVGLQ